MPDKAAAAFAAHGRYFRLIVHMGRRGASCERGIRGPPHDAAGQRCTIYPYLVLQRRAGTAVGGDDTLALGDESAGDGLDARD